MAASWIELGRNPKLTTTTEDGGETHTLDVNAVVNLGNVTVGEGSVADTGDPVPDGATLIGWDDAGTLVSVSVTNPLPIVGNLSVSEGSVGTTGDPVPAGATFIGYEDGSGDLIGVSEATPLPVVGEVTGNLTLEASDIQIGAVEIKNATTDDRLVISAAGAAKVDGSGVTQPISAASLPLPTGAATAANQTTANASLGNIDTNTATIASGVYAEDDASANGHAGFGVLGVRQDTPANTGADGDYEFLKMSGGRLWASTIITGNVSVIGPTAENSAVATAPVTIGGRAKTALPTAVDDGDAINWLMSKFGQGIVRLALRENQGAQFTYLTNTTKTTIVTADANNRLDIHRLVISNKSSGTISVLIEDDATARTEYTLPAGTFAGFSGSLPLLQAAGNKSWSATLSATPSGGNVSVTAEFVKAGS